MSLDETGEPMPALAEEDSILPDEAGDPVPALAGEDSALPDGAGEEMSAPAGEDSMSPDEVGDPMPASAGENSALPDGAGEGMPASAGEDSMPPDETGDPMPALAGEDSELPDGAGDEMPALAGEDSELPDGAGDEMPAPAGEDSARPEPGPADFERMVEALLFASTEPLSVRELESALPEGCDTLAVLEALQERYAGRGVNLRPAGAGWVFRTAPDLGWLFERAETRERRLSRAALETLAIIAYHQPVSRAEIEEIRGVAVSRGTVNALMEMGWVGLGRRRRSPGRPTTYIVTDGFLDHFGLASARDLPGIKELKALGLLERPAAAVMAAANAEEGQPETGEPAAAVVAAANAEEGQPETGEPAAAVVAAAKTEEGQPETGEPAAAVVAAANAEEGQPETGEQAAEA